MALPNEMKADLAIQENNMEKLVYLFVFIALSFGCRPAKKATRQNSNGAAIYAAASTMDSASFIEKTMNAVEQQRVEFSSFSARMKVATNNSDGKNNDFTAYLRIYRDSAIWISVNAVLGIEAARLLITPDSIRLINKLDKEYRLRSIHYLEELTGIPLNFFDLQSLLLGEPIYLTDTIYGYELQTVPSSLIIQSRGKQFHNRLQLDAQSLLPQYIYIEDLDPLKKRSAEIYYQQYIDINNGKFPNLRRLILTERQKITVEMEVKQVDFNEVLSLPFSIPKNYSGY